MKSKDMVEQLLNILEGVPDLQSRNLRSGQLKNLLLASFLSGNHVLLFDYPDSGVEHLAAAIGGAVKAEERAAIRSIRCTAETSIADLIGSASAFPLVLCLRNLGRLAVSVQNALNDLLRDLACEINGKSHKIAQPFMVVATHDYSDTIGLSTLISPLRRAFLVSVDLQMPPASKEIATIFGADGSGIAINNSNAVSADSMTAFRKQLQQGKTDQSIVDRIADIFDKLEKDARIQINGRPSASTARNFVDLLYAYTAVCKCEGSENMKIPELAFFALAPHVRKKSSVIDSTVTIVAKACGVEKSGAGPIADAESKISSLSAVWENVYMPMQSHLAAYVMGRDNDNDQSGGLSTLDLILTAILSEGHVLFEDFPGSGKSYMAKTLAECISDDIREEIIDIEAHHRIQCTPDLLPSDITGYVMMDGGQMRFRRGPVFCYILLIDEINRTTPKVQSSLLEAMAERQVTVDDHTYALGDLFFVIATQNPLDKVGTFELPSAQLDRFLFKRCLEPLKDREVLKAIMNMNLKEAEKDKQKIEGIPVPVSHVIAAIKCIENSIKDTKLGEDFLLDLADAIQHRQVGDPESDKIKQKHGAEHLLKVGSRPSPRTLQKFIKSAKVASFIKNAKANKPLDSLAVDPVVIKQLAKDLLRHRIVPNVQTHDDRQVEEIIDEAVKGAVEVFERKYETQKFDFYK